jgi:hypothetical protein
VASSACTMLMSSSMMPQNVMAIWSSITLELDEDIVEGRG